MLAKPWMRAVRTIPNLKIDTEEVERARAKLAMQTVKVAMMRHDDQHRPEEQHILTEMRLNVTTLEMVHAMNCQEFVNPDDEPL
jgi:hypothetical protein